VPVLAQVTLIAASGLAEDDVVNTFAFITPGGFDPVADIDDIALPLNSFYNGANASGNSITSQLGPSRSRAAGGMKVDLYDIDGHLDGSPHGSPVATTSFPIDEIVDLGELAERSLPEEVALAISLRANGWEEAAVEQSDGGDAGAALDRPRQRRTGKLYIGPFIVAVVRSGLTVARPSTELITDLLDASERLFDQASVNSCIWSVWSRTDATLRSLTDVQVDDAFDTQRRRGVDAAARTTRALV
jgi:hypothetical protein